MTTTREAPVRRRRTSVAIPLAMVATLVLACAQGEGTPAPVTPSDAVASATLVKPRAEIEAAWTQAQTIADDMYASNRTAVYDMFHSVRLTTDWWVWSQDPLSFMNGVMLSTPDFESRLKIRELRLLDGPVTCGASLQGCTIFPAPLAVAGSWDPDQAVAMYAAQGAEKKAKGANLSLSPTMQIIRDPRGGRNFESFSEDPYLSAQLAASAVTGIQSNNIIATAKHYVDNDQETNRDTIVVNVDDRTQHEIYLAPFKAAVDAGAGAFMCSYNRIATPTGSDFACENSHVLKTLLKGELGFRGFVLSDWGATHSGAKAANAGLDVEMNDNRFFLDLNGQITDATAREMARRIVFAHLITDLDDNPAAKVTKAQGVETRVVSTAANRDTAQRTAEQSIVLLKNAAASGVPLLPLSKTNRNVAVFGECAETNHVFQGKGSAEGLTTGKSIMTPRQAIASALGVTASTIPYGTEANIDAAVSLANGKAAAIVVLCATSMEGYGDGGDRAGLNFGAARSFSNPNSDALATRIAATGTPTVVMVVSPGQMTMPWAGSVRAILWAGLLGEMQAPAIARVLFGDVNPSGKLPVTFGASLDDFPTRSSVYGNVTELFPGNGTNVYYREGLFVGYRHFDARNITPLFPFGHGLSYTSFGYANLSVTPSVNAQADEGVTVSLDLTNTGTVAGAEVVQVYLGFPAAAGEPPRVLKGFRKVSLTPGQTQRVSLALAPDAYEYWSNGWVPATGTFQVLVGSSSRDVRLTGSFEVTNGTSSPQTLTVAKTGAGTGTVTTTPAGVSCGSTCTASFASGTVVTLTATAATGSWFAGWGGACTGSSPCTVTMTAARSVSATFNVFPPEWLLTVTRSGAGSGTVTGGGAIIDCGTTCSATLPGDVAIVLTAAASAGSTFAGWSGACTGTSPTCTVGGSGNRTVDARFDPAGTTSTLLSQGKPATASSTSSSSFPASNAVDASTTTRWASRASNPQWIRVDLGQRANVDQVVLRWASTYGRAYQIQVSDDGTSWTSIYSTTTSTGGLQTLAVTGAGRYVRMYGTARSSTTSGYSLYDFQVWGTFGPIAETVLTVTKTGNGTGTVTSSPAAISCGTTCTATYLSPTTVTLTAAAAGGSTFGGWSGACTGTAATCTVSMTASRNVGAAFNAPVNDIGLTVTRAGTGSGTVTSTPAGINCGSACSLIYASGAVVTLTATAASGSTFAGWSGACTGTAATCVLTMNASQAVQATFQVVVGEVSLIVTKAGTGSGTVAAGVGGIDCGSVCTATYGAGASVTLTATASSGSTFAGWGGDCAGTAATCTVSMTAARAVTATFDGGSTPCANPVTFTSNTGNFNTTGAVCYRTGMTVNGWGCSNFGGRTVSVNGGAATGTCGAGPFPLPKASDGYTYFSVTAGQYPWASIYLW